MWTAIISFLLNKASENSPGLRKAMPFINAANMMKGNSFINGKSGNLFDNSKQPWDLY